MLGSWLVGGSSSAALYVSVLHVRTCACTRNACTSAASAPAQTYARMAARSQDPTSVRTFVCTEALDTRIQVPRVSQALARGAPRAITHTMPRQKECHQKKIRTTIQQKQNAYEDQREYSKIEQFINMMSKK